MQAMILPGWYDDLPETCIESIHRTAFSFPFDRWLHTHKVSILKILNVEGRKVLMTVKGQRFRRGHALSLSTFRCVFVGYCPSSKASKLVLCPPQAREFLSTGGLLHG